MVNTFKKHGLKLWLANLLGSLATSIVIFFVGSLIFIVLLLLGIATAISASSFDEILAHLSYGSIGIIALLIFGFIAYLMVVILSMSFQLSGQYATADGIFKYNRVRLADYFTKGFKFTFKMFLLLLLNTVLIIPVLILLSVAIYLMFSMDSFGMVTGIMLILLSMLLMFLLGLALCYSPFILVAENTNVISAITLSLRLFSKNFGKVFVTLLMSWGIALIYIAVNFLLYLPIFLGLFDPTGVLVSLISLFVNILQWIYSVVGLPFVSACIGLIFAYRYYQYFRPILFPDNPEDPQHEPIFTFKS